MCIITWTTTFVIIESELSLRSVLRSSRMNVIKYTITNPCTLINRYSLAYTNHVHWLFFKINASLVVIILVWNSFQEIVAFLSPFVGITENCRLMRSRADWSKPLFMVMVCLLAFSRNFHGQAHPVHVKKSLSGRFCRWIMLWYFCCERATTDLPVNSREVAFSCPVIKAIELKWHILFLRVIWGRNPPRFHECHNIIDQISHWFSIFHVRKTTSMKPIVP